jgi:ABC-2 type transport system ATP-binding protein
VIATRTLVETLALAKNYGDLSALQDCTLSVQAGEVFGLLGPNGSGKTTLIRLLLGYLRPTRGRALIAGYDCYHDSVLVHQKLSYLPGDARLFRRMRGHEVLRFFADVRPSGDFATALQIADRLELDLTRQVAYYSTGMRQKLALAAALSINAPLLILDEPTTNLDPTIRGEVLKMVREARHEGRTVIFSSHVLSEVEQSCDRVAILRRGELVHTQVMADLRRQHRIRARLTGVLAPPPAHLLPELKIETNGNGEVRIETPGELSPLLGWLAELPLTEVKIEPVGLQTLYDRYHQSEF